jgi:transposase
MNKSKPYAAISVKQVQELGLAQVMEGLDGPEVWVGIDVSKAFLMVAPCVGPGRFGRPWRVAQPSQLGVLVELLTALSATRKVTVALEPTGTYADPLRWALTRAKLDVRRIETKASHDYAEVFDGVPSQHDGKDAAMLAELAMHGKSTAWPLELKDERDSTMRALVEAADDQQRVLSVWTGRLEGLLARHWPEATEALGLDSATLLWALERYGGPAALAEDAAAEQALLSHGGHWLSAAKVQALIDGARRTAGVPVNEAESQRLAHCARSALAAMHELKAVKRKLAKLTKGDAVLERMSEVAGPPTACVLFTLLGSPLAYGHARAYLKAAGLNLAERSSGTYRGQLKISKRGPAMARRWLYMAAVRLSGTPAGAAWFAAKRARDSGAAGGGRGGGGRGGGAGASGPRRRGTGLIGLVALMRKLAVALWAVCHKDQAFDVNRLFAAENAKPARRAAPRPKAGAAAEQLPV